MALQWHVARTKPLGEQMAADGLKRMGVEVFSPRVRAPRFRRGRQDCPLFPGYLFVRCDLGEDWRSLLQLPGLRGLVQFQGVVPSVPDEVITELSQRVEAINQNGGLHKQLHAGEKVYVTLGTTESVAEVVGEPKSGRRVHVLMEFLDRMVHAEAPLENVRLIGDHELAIINNSHPPRRTRGKGRWIRDYRPAWAGVGSEAP